MHFQGTVFLSLQNRMNNMECCVSFFCRLKIVLHCCCRVYIRLIACKCVFDSLCSSIRSRHECLMHIRKSNRTENRQNMKRTFNVCIVAKCYNIDLYATIFVCACEFHSYSIFGLLPSLFCCSARLFHFASSEHIFQLELGHMHANQHTL